MDAKHRNTPGCVQGHPKALKSLLGALKRPIAPILAALLLSPGCLNFQATVDGDGLSWGVGVDWTAVGEYVEDNLTGTIDLPSLAPGDHKEAD